MCGQGHSCDAPSTNIGQACTEIRSFHTGGIVALDSAVHKTLIVCSGILFGTLNLAAQTLQVGALGGVIATSPNAFRDGESKRYVIGPSVELRLFGTKLGIELDALYRRVGDSYASEF